MWYWEVCWTQNVSSQDSLLIRHPRLQVLYSNPVQQMTVLRRWRFWEYLASLGESLWPCVSASLFSRKLSWHWKKGWQGKEEDEITAGELLWLSFHRAQWLKVNLEFCTLSDCPGVSSHQTSSCVPSRLELKLLFEFASCCLELQLQVV